MIEVIEYVVAPFLYFIMMGLVYGKARPHMADGFNTFFAALLWWATIPVCIGRYLSKFEYISRAETKEKKLTAQRERELSEAHHKQRLAEINAKTIALKEQEAGIPIIN